MGKGGIPTMAKRSRLTYVFFTFPKRENCKNAYDYIRKLKRILSESAGRPPPRLRLWWWDG
jgi:hypothetical protein